MWDALVFQKSSTMGNTITLENRKAGYLAERASSINYNHLKHNSVDRLLARIRRSVEIAPRCGEHRVEDVPYFQIHRLLQSPAWKLLEEDLRETYGGLEIGNLALWQRDEYDDGLIWDLTFDLRQWPIVEK